MRNLQAFFIEPDLVVREIPGGCVNLETTGGGFAKVSLDQLPDLITAITAMCGSFPNAEAGAKADAILKLMYGLAGFDHWWDTVASLDRLNIRNEIASLLTR